MKLGAYCSPPRSHLFTCHNCPKGGQPHHTTERHRIGLLFAFGRNQPVLAEVSRPEGVDICRAPVNQAISPVLTDDKQSFAKQNSKPSHRLTRSAHTLDPSNPFRRKTQKAFSGALHKTNAVSTLEIYSFYVCTPSRVLYRWQYSAGAFSY
jgi:hypothetical protein